MLCGCWGVPAVLVCAVPLQPGAAVREHGCARRGSRTGRVRVSASGSPAEPWLPPATLQQRSRSRPPVPEQGWRPCADGVGVLETWRAPELPVSFSLCRKLLSLSVGKCLMNMTTWKASRAEMVAVLAPAPTCARQKPHDASRLRGAGCGICAAVPGQPGPSRAVGRGTLSAQPGQPPTPAALL